MTDLSNLEFIRELNAHLNAGGVIAFPTDTVWGLGSLPTAAGANALYAIKRRPREKHLIIMSNSMENIRPHMKSYPATAFDLAARYWPGVLTIATPTLDADTMVFGGVRIPNYQPFMDLCAVIDGHCLATTSANISGMPPLQSADEIRKTFPEIIVIDNPYQPMGGRPSTVALCTPDGIRVVRPGAVVTETAD